MKTVLLEPAVQTLIRRSAQRHASRGQRHTNRSFPLLPHGKNKRVLLHCLKGESEFLRQVKMQSCMGSLELGNADSGGGAVSNQVLFTSHIVLKPDVIPIPSALTCHRLRREIDLFAKNQIYLEDASSEPAEGRKPACNSPLKKYSQDLGTPRDEPGNQCHSQTSRRFLSLAGCGSAAVASPGSGDGAAPGGAGGGRGRTHHCSRARPGAGDAA